MTAVLGMPFPEVAGQLEIWCMQSRFAWRHSDLVRSGTSITSNEYFPPEQKTMH